MKTDDQQQCGSDQEKITDPISGPIICPEKLDFIQKKDYKGRGLLSNDLNIKGGMQ